MRDRPHVVPKRWRRRGVGPSRLDQQERLVQSQEHRRGKRLAPGQFGEGSSSSTGTSDRWWTKAESGSERARLPPELLDNNGEKQPGQGAEPAARCATTPTAVTSPAASWTVSSNRTRSTTTPTGRPPTG